MAEEQTSTIYIQNLNQKINPKGKLKRDQTESVHSLPGVRRGSRCKGSQQGKDERPGLCGHAKPFPSHPFGPTITRSGFLWIGNKAVAVQESKSYYSVFLQGF